MSRWLLLVGSVLGVLLVVPRPAESCSLCIGKLRMVPTLRQEASQATARVIVVGTLQNPRLGADGMSGTTDLQITQVLRGDPSLGNQKKITLSRYLPFLDVKNPPRFLIFCDVVMNRLDDYRGVPLKSDDGVEYVNKVMKLSDRDPQTNLQFFFRYLDHNDKELANDAFMEFAKTTDVMIGQVAPKLPVDRLRAWVRDPNTSSEKLSLYAFMLGSAGNVQDAALLMSMLNDGSERISKAHDGILCGLMNLKPAEGWTLVHNILRDGKKSLEDRLNAIRAIRFYQGWQPEKYQAQILKALAIIIAQGELADIAIEDLRKWKLWDQTREVLGLYGKKGYESPLLKDAIIRYALSCPSSAETARFLEERRKADPKQVEDIEGSLKP